MRLAVRDLVVLRVVSEWNRERVPAIAGAPSRAQNALAFPCTISVLYNQDDGGEVNKFIDRESLDETTKITHLQQIYRSVEKLINAGLLESNQTRRSQYYASSEGQRLADELSRLDPASWQRKLDKIN